MLFNLQYLAVYHLCLNFRVFVVKLVGVRKFKNIEVIQKTVPDTSGSALDNYIDQVDTRNLIKHLSCLSEKIV